MFDYNKFRIQMSGLLLTVALIVVIPIVSISASPAFAQALNITYPSAEPVVKLKNVRLVSTDNLYKQGSFLIVAPPTQPLQIAQLESITAENSHQNKNSLWWLVLLLLIELTIIGVLLRCMLKDSQQGKEIEVKEEVKEVKEDKTQPIPNLEPEPIQETIEPQTIQPIVDATPNLEPEPIQETIEPQTIQPIVDATPNLEPEPIQETIEPQTTQLIVDATWGNDENEMNHLPTYQNPYDKTIVIKIESEGTWTYGAPDPVYQFDLQVDANGNQKMAEKERQDNDMRFPNILPAALVAIKNGEVVATGKGPYEVTLHPHESVSFVINDEPGFYKDNTGQQIVSVSVVKFES